MKKLFLVAALAVSSFFAANAQFGAHLNLGKSLDEGAEGFGIGVDAQYLFSVSDAFAVGPEVGFAKVVGHGFEGVSYTNIWYQAVAKYFIGGSSEDGGFYPQLNIGMATNRASADGFSFSSTDIQYGLGVGYKLESGFDIAARYNMIAVEGGSSKGLLIQVGMFF